MPKDEWGTKRMCPHCATRFYDLQNDPMTCPACGESFTAESLVAGRGRMLVAEKVSARAGASVDADVDSDNDEVIEAEDDLAAVESDSELDDDLLEDDDDDSVSLDDIADVAEDDEEG